MTKPHKHQLEVCWFFNDLAYRWCEDIVFAEHHKKVRRPDNFVPVSRGPIE